MCECIAKCGHVLFVSRSNLHAYHVHIVHMSCVPGQHLHFAGRRPAAGPSRLRLVVVRRHAGSVLAQINSHSVGCYLLLPAVALSGGTAQGSPCFARGGEGRRGKGRELYVLLRHNQYKQIHKKQTLRTVHTISTIYCTNSSTYTNVNTHALIITIGHSYKCMKCILMIYDKSKDAYRNKKYIK